jgi:hypothetical protein
MKILIGYYDKDGKHIGNKLDTNRRKKFYVAMGTFRKKIAEHPEQSPYKTHEKVLPYSKNFSDKPRLMIHLEEYDEGRKKTEIHTFPYIYGDRTNKYDYARRICEHIKTNLRRMVETTDMKMVYLPSGDELNLEERRR